MKILRIPKVICLDVTLEIFVVPAFDAEWQRRMCHGHMAHSEWWIPVFCLRDFWVSDHFSISQVLLLKPFFFSSSSLLFLSLLPLLLCVFLLRAFWLSPTLSFLSLVFWDTVSLSSLFSFYRKIYLPFLFYLRIEISHLFLSSVIESSEVRQLCPSISFFFAHLGASLGSFSTHCPPIEGFVSRGSSLGFVLADLHHLLHQSLNWFKEMVGEREVVSEVR